MKLNSIYIIGLFCGLLTACGSSKSLFESSTLLQEYAFEEIELQQKEGPRPLLVFLHADWCNYCQHMKQGTFRNPEVIAALNKDFYFVSFNGESQQSVQFAGQEFRFEATGRNIGVHRLAKTLGSEQGELVYPAVVILNAQNEVLFRHQAYLDAEALLTILHAVPKS